MKHKGGNKDDYYWRVCDQDGELRVWWIDTGEENNTIEEIP